MQKPDKGLLDNTNFQFALAPHNANQGNLRETFFANQVSFQNNLEFSEYGDFLVNGKWTLEIGGNNKIGKQIRNVPNSFVVPDDTEYATNGRIPLWMFGLLY
jgi:hypothetical protein